MGASQSAEKRVIPVNERRRLGAHPSTNRTRRYGNPVIMKNMVEKSIGNTRRTIQRRPSGNLSTNRTRSTQQAIGTAMSPEHSRPTCLLSLHQTPLRIGQKLGPTLLFQGQMSAARSSFFSPVRTFSRVSSRPTTISKQSPFLQTRPMFTRIWQTPVFGSIVTGSASA